MKDQTEKTRRAIWESLPEQGNGSGNIITGSVDSRIRLSPAQAMTIQEVMDRITSQTERRRRRNDEWMPTMASLLNAIVDNSSAVLEWST